MAHNLKSRLPVWAPRLRKTQITRLYESCGQGFIDEELIDDVGFSLYARCKSILEATEAMRGRPLCVTCKAAVPRTNDPDETLKCSNCGWECSWKAYQKTFKHKGLTAVGMIPFVREFVHDFQKARSPLERLILIDTIIHRFHWEQTGQDGGRPVVSSLIEGSMKKTMAFLDQLTYGDQLPPEMKQTRKQWRDKWYNNAWSQGKGQ